jgi:hypothetical protein
MNTAVGCNTKNNLFSLIRIFYSSHVWKGHGLMAPQQTSYCAGYNLGYHGRWDVAALLYGGQQ